MSPSARIIVDLNIKHFRALLGAVHDAGKRRAIVKLLAEQERKLVEALKDEVSLPTESEAPVSFADHPPPQAGEG